MFLQSIKELLGPAWNQIIKPGAHLLWSFWPLWLAIILFDVFWHKWLEYVKTKFFASQKHILLEIGVPRDIFKSPLAMELFLSALHQTSGESTWFARNFQGKTRPWFSLELVSIGGEIHFYIWTRAPWRGWIESQLYAQYPEAVITEVDDYTSSVFFHEKEMGLWGADIVLLKDDAYPIKTYIDYGLDRESKEELRIDPITPMIEFLGSLRPGEQVWIQIIIQAHKAAPHNDWPKRSRELAKKLVKENAEKLGLANPNNITPGIKDIITAIERNISKLGFDTGIREIYLATPDLFNPINISAMNGSFKQYAASNLNGFRPKRYLADFDFPWQDFKQMRQNKARKKILEAYKLRSYFYPPHKTPSYVLNTESLATIFHFPGQVSKTPSLKRLDSRRAEPPANLPI